MSCPHPSRQELARQPRQQQAQGDGYANENPPKRRHRSEHIERHRKRFGRNAEALCHDLARLYPREDRDHQRHGDGQGKAESGPAIQTFLDRDDPTKGGDTTGRGQNGQCYPIIPAGQVGQQQQRQEYDRGDNGAEPPAVTQDTLQQPVHCFEEHGETLSGKSGHCGWASKNAIKRLERRSSASPCSFAPPFPL